jgi:hypothetical protein
MVSVPSALTVLSVSNKPLHRQHWTLMFGLDRSSWPNRFRWRLPLGMQVPLEKCRMTHDTGRPNTQFGGIACLVTTRQDWVMMLATVIAMIVMRCL